MSEILAPCGSYESLVAAVNSGTDAVYLGEESFSARKNAANFSYEQLCEAVKLCHYSSVKVYVTLNTLVFDKEIPALKKAIINCAKADVDAFIVQDLGVAKLARDIVPDMPLHASTQMTVNSLHGARLLKKLGFSRVVLGRELSYEQIKTITEGCDIETEVFVHGALCVCFSGQCYMSSVLGGRSGNRGLCAQPCRLNFTSDKRQNVISLKDLSIIEHLEALKSAGVTSFKIEGRMKRPEYVAGTVNACRTVINGGKPDLESLKCVFSRSGFTTGYFADDFTNMQGVRTKEDVVSAPKALTAMKQLYHKPFVRYDANISAVIKKDEPIVIKAQSQDIAVTVIGNEPETAINKAVDKEYITKQLSKLGGTLYKADRVSAEVDDGLVVSASELNEMRRKAIASLSEKILEKNSNNYKLGKVEEVAVNSNKKIRPEFRCEIATKEQLSQVLQEDEYSYIYVPMKFLDENTEDKFRIVIVPPVFLGDCEEKIIAQLKKLKSFGYENVCAPTLSHIEIINQLNMKTFGSFRLNITNSYSLSEYRRLGVADAVLSVELMMRDAQELCGSSFIKTGIIGYGKLPLMITRRCPINDNKPCGKSKRKDCPHSITDRQGNTLKCYCDDNAVEIFNPDTLILSDRQKDISKFDFILLKFTDEEDTHSILDMYLNDIKPDGKLTRGLYYRGVQ
ncbi:MAG: U32 family peptidase [Ruminococcaceae bacterium]|nr:U32 family peptidase [Oscillospiraceae bacterium]